MHFANQHRQERREQQREASLVCFDVAHYVLDVRRSAEEHCA